MQQTTCPAGAGHRAARWKSVAALVALVAALGGSAHAVEFDEKVKAPLMKSPADVMARAQTHTENFERLRAASPVDLIKDRALARERFDLSWQIKRAIDTGKPLGDLSAIGLTPAENGAYRINYSANPQWQSTGDIVAALLTSPNWDVLSEDLIRRGFRAEDVALVRAYAETHDPYASARERALPLAVSFSKVVKKYEKIKRPVPDALVLSFLYQRNSVESEAVREWMSGLLDTLDAQRARILASYFSEMKSAGIWAPSDQSAGIADLLATMRRPDYEKLATAEARGEAP